MFKRDKDGNLIPDFVPKSLIEEDKGIEIIKNKKLGKTIMRQEQQLEQVETLRLELNTICEQLSEIKEKLDEILRKLNNILEKDKMPE